MARNDHDEAPAPAMAPTVAETIPAAAAAPGQPVDGARVGRYLLRERLGAGAMGEVWRAYDPQLDRDIAIKLVHPRLARSTDVAARMLREARAMAKLSHRGVVAVHDAGEDDGQLFIAMELVRGRTFGAILRERSPEQLLDWRRYLAMMLDAGRGLAAAHAAGVLHRDFKPDNVLIDHSGRVCVGDFGLASLGDTPRSRVSRPAIERPPEPELTVTGALLGTPAYMSPEQLLGGDVDARADQFAFCVAAHEALYGARPFKLPDEERGNLAALLDAIEARAICPPPADTSIPSALRELVLRGLAPRPAERWPDLDALLAALEPFATPAIAATPRRRRIVLAAAAAALLLGVALRRIVSRRAPPRRPSSAAAMAAPHPLEAVSINAAIDLSAGGLLAIGTDRLQVLELDAPAKPPWQLALPRLALAPWAEHVELDGEDVVQVSYRMQQAFARWPFRAGGPIQLLPQGDARWLGGDTHAAFVEHATPDGTQIAFVRDGRPVRSWSIDVDLGQNVPYSLTPDHTKLAFLDAIDRYTGRLAVLDGATGRADRSAPISGLASLAFRSGDRLLYGTRGDHAEICALTVGPGGLGEPRRVLAPAAEWIGVMAANRDRVVYGEVVTENRAHVVSDDASKRHDFEPSEAATALGWQSNDKFVVWNHTGLELRDAINAGRALHVHLTGEPQSATFAGDLLIVALRGNTGRELVAYDLAAGGEPAAPLWQMPEGAALTARCAGDGTPPCFVARRVSARASETYEIVPLDPRTGALGDDVRYRGPLLDFAVHPDGKHLLVVEGNPRTTVQTELDDGGRRRTIEIPVYVSSIAYTSDGGLVAAGALAANRYGVEVSRGGTFHALFDTDGEQLSLVRPSPDGERVLVLGRQRKLELVDQRLPLR